MDGRHSDCGSIALEDESDVRAASHQRHGHGFLELKSHAQILVMADHMPEGGGRRRRRRERAAGYGEVWDKGLNDESWLNYPRRVAHGYGSIFGLNQIWMNVFRRASIVEDEVQPWRVRRQRRSE